MLLFKRLRLRPRRLQGISQPNSSMEIFGCSFDIPVILDVADGVIKREVFQGKTFQLFLQSTYSCLCNFDI